MWKLLVRLVAVVVLTAAASVLLVAPPAQAAVCPGATGVTVVVDFHQLGGGVKTGCAGSGGGKAASVSIPAAGFPLTYVQRSPGFVCRVSGVPSTDACVVTPPATKYWSLWWSDGKTGKWSYSSLGAGSLNIPTGGYVAFSWQGQSGQSAPGFTPKKRVGLAVAAPEKTPSPTKSPAKSDKPGKSGSSDQSSQGADPTDSPTPTTAEESQRAGEESPKAGKSPGANKRPVESNEPSESPTAEASESESAAPVASVDPPSSGGSGGLPIWLTVSLFAALAAAIGGVSFVRGRRTGTSVS